MDSSQLQYLIWRPSFKRFFHISICRPVRSADISPAVLRTPPSFIQLLMYGSTTLMSSSAAAAAEREREMRWDGITWSGGHTAINAIVDDHQNGQAGRRLLIDRMSLATNGGAKETVGPYLPSVFSSDRGAFGHPPRLHPTAWSLLSDAASVR